MGGLLCCPTPRDALLLPKKNKRPPPLDAPRSEKDVNIIITEGERERELQASSVKLGAAVRAVDFTRRSISHHAKLMLYAARLQAALRGHLTRSARASGRERVSTIQMEGETLACQAGGHSDAFRCEKEDKGRLVTKETCKLELNVYEALQSDRLASDGFTARFHGTTVRCQQSLDDGFRWLRLENLTHGCKKACVMDCKMGTRTFLESEVKNTKLRADLAEKMIKQGGGDLLTEDERANGITKLKYMQFREATSSSSTLGWRLEAIVLPANSDEEAAEEEGAETTTKIDTKKLQERPEILDAIRTFLSAADDEHRHAVAEAMLERLVSLRAALEASPFFKTHEVIGSSLLFVYDAAYPMGRPASASATASRGGGRNTAPGCWMIDFAKTSPLSSEVADKGTHNHRHPWEMGNQEDGYLFGVDTLIEAWQEIVKRERSTSSA